jgi:hypothetical protein
MAPMFRNSYAICIAASIVLAAGTICSKVAVAQSPPASSEHNKSSLPSAAVLRPRPPQDHEQYVAYWTTEPGWRTELQLRNNLDPGDLTVTPALRTADGTETTIPPVTIKSGDVVSLDLSETLLKAAPQLVGFYGSLVLRYRATGSRALYAAVMVRADGHPIAFHMDATFHSFDPTSASREGIWWLPRDSVTDYLILTNAAGQKLDGTLVLYDSNGQAWRQPLSLGARQTQRYSVRSLLQRTGLTGSYGAIKIEAVGGTGYLGSAHLIFDESGGFGAIMKMFNHDPATTLFSRSFGGVKEWTTRAPMLALSDPDPTLGFPAGTTLQPKVFVHNTSTSTYTAHIRFNWRSATAAGRTTPVDLVLKPNATQVVDVAALQAQKLIPGDAHWAAVVLSAPAQPNDLMAVAASYDQTGRYGAQTPFSDQLASHWEGGKWELDSTHDSLVTIGNGSNKPARAELTILYNHGSDQYQIEQTLAPDEQMLVDFGKLIREQTPDKQGRVLPADLTSGAYRVRDLADPVAGGVYEGKVIVEKNYGHAAYGCMTCCGPEFPLMGIDPLPVPVDSSNLQSVSAPNSCTGEQENVTGYFPTWWTDDTSIATANKNKISGVAPGTTDHHAQSELMYWGFKEYGNPCPESQPEPSAGTLSYTPIQHTYPSNPLPKTCWISRFFDSVYNSVTHRAQDVVYDNGQGTGGVSPPYGTPVYAEEAGKVVKAVSGLGPASVGFPACVGKGYHGNFVEIQSTSDGYYTVYYHVSPIVSVGQSVSAGQEIGTLDNSGCQSGAHLHMGRKGPNGWVNFTVPCTNPLPKTGFQDGLVADDDPSDPTP